MPRTRRQALLFGLLMSVFMTFGMEVYNNAVKAGMHLLPGGLSNMDWSIIAGAAEELPLMVAIVFLVSNLYGNRCGRALAQRITDPERDSELFCNLVTIACTTLVMYPSMSLVASVLFNVILAGRPIAELPVIWLVTVYKNFACALLWNVFAASPAARLSFRALMSLRVPRASVLGTQES